MKVRLLSQQAGLAEVDDDFGRPALAVICEQSPTPVPDGNVFGRASGGAINPGSQSGSVGVLFRRPTDLPLNQGEIVADYWAVRLHASATTPTVRPFCDLEEPRQPSERVSVRIPNFVPAGGTTAESGWIRAVRGTHNLIVFDAAGLSGPRSFYVQLRWMRLLR